MLPGVSPSNPAKTRYEVKIFLSSNKTSSHSQDIAQSTLSLYQKPNEMEGADGLLSPTSVLSSVIDETPEPEAKDNVVIVVENNL